jgi:hypothetical protein
VPELHHENSYASRLYSYMGQKNQVDLSDCKEMRP